MKLYLVKREVYAKDIRAAAIKKGTVYEIVLADERFQPDNEKKDVGFKKKK